MSSSTVRWIATKDALPDDDMTVLAAFSDGEVWTGFVEADTWHYVSGDPMETPPTHWAQFPEPPR